ncbi:unnamed protein product [Dovyalis caffra]|uniref:Uncharacterized protein n=1 Tax=Dovyalis caffra TaxID=77055 RepID=A0AAV1QQ52_9ROSI|nr:unnamed protein product [Dovyalis caffra]
MDEAKSLHKNFTKLVGKVRTQSLFSHMEKKFFDVENSALTCMPTKDEVWEGVVRDLGSKSSLCWDGFGGYVFLRMSGFH